MSIQDTDHPFGPPLVTENVENLCGLMRHHWEMGTRPPEFQQLVRAGCPDASLAEFNAAAAATWAEIGRDKSADLSTIQVKDGWLVDAAGRRVKSFTEVSATLSGLTGLFIGGTDEGGFIFQWKEDGSEDGGFESYPPYSLPPIAITESPCERPF